jgi:hypothetical protein
MKKVKVLAAVALLGIATGAQAASYTVLATSKISNWTAANGVSGGTGFNTVLGGNPDFMLSGTVDTVGMSFAISSMTLNQVGSTVGFIPTVPSVNLTISGMSWSYGTNANDAATAPTSDFALNQTAGSAVCSASDAACNGTQNSINGGGNESVLSWDGRSATDAWLNNMFIPQIEGVVGGATFAGVVPNIAGPGTVRLFYNLAGFSTVPQSAFFNSSVKGLLTLDLAPVPVPAAAWLFGSALGLFGAMRRRASVA